MGQTARKPEIVSLVHRDGKVTVDGLVTHFRVTPQTIRRDLTELAEDGRLERVHGGAVLPSATVNIGYSERARLNQSAKADIARACAQAIPNDCAVFLNIGTTTEAVAKELLNHRGLLVVTNNINIAMILSAAKGIETVVTGGHLRRTDGGLIGELAKETITQFRFDISVIGCSALGEDGSILDYDMQEVGVSKSILAHSERVFLAADATKFARKAPARIGTVAQVDTVFTNAPPPSNFAAFCAENRVDIGLCQNSAGA